MKPRKLECLEGVRALACIGVVLCHFYNGFFPNSGLMKMITRTPFNYLFSGNTAVRILFALSGFVLCYKYFRTDDYKAVERDTVKRYLRLMLPVLAVNVLVCLMMMGGLLWNHEAAAYTGSQEFMGLFNQFEPDLLQSIKVGVWESVFYGNSIYVGPFWTMKYEMIGSFLTLAAAAILRSKRARYVFYAVYLVMFSDYYIYFILGMMICDIYTHEESVNLFFTRHKWLTLVLHIAAWAYIGGVVNIDVFRIRGLLFYAAVILMFLTLLNSGILGRVWGNKAGVVIGKHSFSIYLLHWPVIESFSCFYFLFMMRRGLSLNANIITNFILTLGVIMAVSAAFTYGVVLPAARLSDKAAGFVIEGRTKKNGREKMNGTETKE